MFAVIVWLLIMAACFSYLAGWIFFGSLLCGLAIVMAIVGLTRDSLS